MRTRATALALLVAVTTALASCAPSEPGAEGTTEPAGAPTGSAGIRFEGQGELFDVNPTAREELARGGQLRRAVSALPTQWNPMHVAGAQGDFTDIRDTMSVRNFDHDGRGRPVPNENYLLDVTDTIDAGQQVITLTLNPQARWNSGDPITWEDYRATLTACDGQDPAYQCVQTGPYAAVESVERGESDFDVVIRFTSTFPDWPALLSEVLPAEAVRDARTFNEGWLDYPREWFTGPFVVDRVDDAQQTLTLVPNDVWWGPEPLLDTVEFRVVAAEALGTAFANGELDVLDVGPDPGAYRLAQDTAGARIRTARSPDWRHLTFNSTAPALRDRAVRQALARAIDRRAIAASDLAGMPAELITPLNNHIFMAGQAGYQDNAADFAYDPRRAAAELTAAGWEVDPATGLREKDGRTLRVDFTVLTGIPTSQNEGQLVQAQLREVGVDVRLVTTPAADFGAVLAEGRFEIIPFSWVGGPYPLLGIGALYGDPATSPLNYARLNNPALNDLIAQIAVETDPEQRLALANEADLLIWESVHTLPLYQRPELVAVPADLANVGALGLSTTRPENWGYLGD